MKVERFFTEGERDRIEASVKSAEKTTAGEIVPMIVEASDDYTEARYAAGVFLALVAFVGVQLFARPENAAMLLASQAVAFIVGFLIFALDGPKRMLVPGRVRDGKVSDRALRAFYEHGLHRTRDETGILIMISLAEHRVQVLADRGINEKVGQETWEEIVKMILAGIRSGRACDAFCSAIERCGEILTEHFPIKPDDIDELGNRLITEE